MLDTLKGWAQAVLEWLAGAAPGVYQTVNDFADAHPFVLSLLDLEGLWFLAAGVGVALVAFARWLRDQFYLAAIRKAAGDKIVILVARFHGDKRDRFQKTLDGLLCEDFTEHGHHAVQSFRLPRRFSTAQTGKAQERAKEKAKAWLRRTNGDVIVWGDDLNRPGVTSGKLMFVGRNRTRETFAIKVLDILANKPGLMAAFLAVMEHELTAVRDSIYAQPETAKTDVLERLIGKYEKLAATQSESLPVSWKQARAHDAQRMRNVLLARLPVVDASDAGQPDAPSLQNVLAATQVQLEQLEADGDGESALWAQTALALARLERRRAFYDIDVDALEHALTLLERAQTIFNRDQLRWEAANCCFERALCLNALRQPMPYPSDDRKENADSVDDAIHDFEGYLPDDFRQPSGAISPSHDRWAGHLLLLYSAWYNGLARWKQVGFYKDDPTEALDRLSSYCLLLDPEGQAELAYNACRVVFYRSREGIDIVGMRRAFTAYCGVTAVSSHFYLNWLNLARATRFSVGVWMTSGNHDDASSHDDFAAADRYVDQYLARYGLRAPYGDDQNVAFFTVRWVDNLSPILSHMARNAASDDAMRATMNQLMDVFKAGISYLGDRFPFRDVELQKDVIVALNNQAYRLGDINAADEAFLLGQTLLSSHSHDAFVHYVVAYAACQKAHLINRENSVALEEVVLQAWALADHLHQHALANHNRDHVVQAINMKKQLKEANSNFLSDADPEALPRDCEDEQTELESTFATAVEIDVSDVLALADDDTKPKA